MTLFSPNWHHNVSLSISNRQRFPWANQFIVKLSNSVLIGNRYFLIVHILNFRCYLNQYDLNHHCLRTIALIWDRSLPPPLTRSKLKKHCINEFLEGARGRRGDRVANTLSSDLHGGSFINSILNEACLCTMYCLSHSLPFYLFSLLFLTDIREMAVQTCRAMDYAKSDFLYETYWLIYSRVLHLNAILVASKCMDRRSNLTSNMKS